MIASTEPCTSPLMTSGNSLRPAVLSWLIMSASEPRAEPPRAAALSRFWRSRYSVISRARASRFDHGDAVARLRRAGEAQHLDRHRGAGVWHVLAQVVDQRAHAAPLRPATTMSPTSQRAALDEHGGHRAAAAVEPRLDDRAFGRRGRDWP